MNTTTAPGRPPRNILMVMPENARGSFWDFTHALKLIGKKYEAPLLGPLLLAAMLPADRYTARLTDCNCSELKDADLAWADLVFISGMSIAHKSIHEVLQRAKRAGRATVCGGPYAGAAWDSLADADCLVIGEAEAVWPAFLADLATGRLRRAYAAPVDAAQSAALRARFGDSAVIADPDQRPGLERMPTPRYDLLDLSAYNLMPVHTSRGCPNHCEFCDIPKRFGQRQRHRPVEKVLEDLDALYLLGWRGGVMFADDNFIGDKPYARKLLKAVALWQAGRGKPFEAAAELSLNLAEDPEMMELCTAAGLNGIFVGLETPHDAGLLEIGKEVNRRGDLYERLEALQRNGFAVYAGFIVGFDADPSDIARRIAECAQRAGIPGVLMNVLYSLPHTGLEARLRREGRLLPVDSLPPGNSPFCSNFRTARPAAEVTASFCDTLRLLYPDDMGAYFERCRIYLLRRGTLKRKWRDILADLAPGAVFPPAQCNGPATLPLWRKLYAVAGIAWNLLTLPYGGNAIRFLLAMRRSRPEVTGHALHQLVEAHHFWVITRGYLQAAGAYGELRDALASLETAAGNAVSAEERQTLRNAANRLLRHAEGRFAGLNAQARTLLEDEYLFMRAKLRALAELP